MRWAAVVLVMLALGVLGAPARADDAAARAAKLFKEGRDLIGAGKIDAACAKFEASFKLDPAIGTKLNLADCLERKGLIAAAYRLFDEAAGEAAKGGKEGRESFARQRADALAKQLVRVEVILAEPATPGMAVTVAGVVVAKADWTAPRYLAPGDIEVEVAAPGRVAFHATIDGHAGEVRKVEVPALDKADGSTTTTGDTGTGTGTGAGTTTAGTGTGTTAGTGTGTGTGPGDGTGPEGKRSSRALAYTVGGVGVALLGTSLGLGLAAKSKFDGAECGMKAMPALPDGVCTDAGQKTTNSARGLADLGTGFAIAGAVAVGVGVWLFVRARHHDHPDHVVVSPSVSDGGVGVVVTWIR